MKRDLLTRGLGLLALTFLAPMAAHAADEELQRELSPVVAVAPSQFGDGGVERERLGTTIQSLTAEDLARAGTLNLTDALQRNLSGVNVSDTQGNGFTNDLNYRGFAATPLQGLPQGLGVYLNGQRMNEAFGDTVNWDLLPEAAVQSADLVTNNPAFGLNALGGALNLRAKDGLSYRGSDVSLQGGSFGYYAGSAQMGWGDDKWGVYGAIDGGQDDGWRQHSESDVLRGYLDFGYKLGQGEVHLTAGASNSTLGVVGPTPVDLLNADRTAVFTWPQVTDNKAQFVTLSAETKLFGAWSVQGGLRYRRFEQSHIDGNDGDFERCSLAVNPAGSLCLEDDAFPAAIRPAAAQFQILDQNNNPILCPTSTAEANGCRNRISAADGPRVPYGTIDRTFTRTNTAGASGQISNDAELFGRKNSFIAGVSYDSSKIHFNSNSTLGLITPALEVTTTYYPLPNITGTVPGLGSVVHAGPLVGYGPAEISVDAKTSGVFASNTLDILPALSLTVGARYNDNRTDMRDLTGTNAQLTGNHKFTRLNPAVNLAWRTGGSTLFVGYAETNRAPTPLELGCSDPTRPCLLENSLVADPPLSQVVSKTVEAGIRGAAPANKGLLSWSASVFTTENTNDIVSLASNLNGRGYFANVPKTTRRGIEGELRYETSTWDVFFNASMLHAQYRFNGLLSSPNNPVANAAGNITITDGDQIGGIPQGRIKVGADIKPLPKLTIGADLQHTSSQYFIGDEGNDNDQLPAYWNANLRADYAISDRVTLFGRVTNLFDRDDATYGAYFDAEGVQKVRPRPLPLTPDEASITPAQPRAFYIGLRAKF